MGWFPLARWLLIVAGEMLRIFASSLMVSSGLIGWWFMVLLFLVVGWFVVGFVLVVCVRVVGVVCG